MASGPITSWQIEEGKVEAVMDFILLGSKTTGHGDCSHKIKTLAPWKKSYEQDRKKFFMTKNKIQDFPDDPVVKTLCFPCRGHGSDSWPMWCGKK